MNQINIKEIAEKLGCSTIAVRSRIKNGWSIERILSTPPQILKKDFSEVRSLLDIHRNLQEFRSEVPDNEEQKTWVKCPGCGNSLLSTMRAVHRTIKKRGSYKCSPCHARSDERRAMISERSKKLWNDESYRSKVTSINAANANTPEGKAQRSKQSKEAWENPEFADFHRSRAKELFQSDDHKKLVSDRNKKAYAEDPEKYIKEKTSVLWTPEARKAHRVALADPEYREKHRQLAKERFENPEYKAKIAKALEGFSRGGKKSRPEKQVEEILSNLGVEFKYNFPLGPYNFDFYLPEHDLFLEIQGEYWHTLKNNERRDKSKYSFLRNSRPESKIIYIWDYDFAIGAALFKISESVGLVTSPGLDFKMTDLELGECDNQEAKRFLQSWHYAQFGKVGKFIFAARINGEIVALVKIGPVSRKEIATSLGSDTKSTFELDRLCIHPMRQKKNLASYILSKACRAFFEKFPKAKILVSFADSTFGHDGTVYKAANWKEHSKVQPDYIYVNADGWSMHKKTLYNQARSVHMTEKDYAEKNGWMKVFGKEKTKFILERK